MVKSFPFSLQEQVPPNAGKKMVGATNQKTKGKKAKEMETKEMEEKEQETGIDFLVIFFFFF